MWRTLSAERVSAEDGLLNKQISPVPPNVNKVYVSPWPKKLTPRPGKQRVCPKETNHLNGVSTSPGLKRKGRKEKKNTFKNVCLRQRDRGKIAEELYRLDTSGTRGEKA